MLSLHKDDADWETLKRQCYRLENSPSRAIFRSGFAFLGHDHNHHHSAHTKAGHHHHHYHYHHHHHHHHSEKKGNEAMRKMASEFIVLGDIIAQIPMISSLTMITVIITGISTLVHCSADENKYN